MHELARGVYEREVVPNQPTKSISVEDTFERDVPLAQTEPMIRRLAEKLWAASRKEPRIARTVILKLKTIEFKILTPSHTVYESDLAHACLLAFCVAAERQRAIVLNNLTNTL